MPFYYGNTDAWGAVTDNAKMLKSTLQEIAERDDVEKFNLIAHSKGGIDARYMISQLNEENIIASLTTVSTPHLGTPIADFFLERYLSEDSITRKLIQKIAFLFGGNSPNPIELIQNLSTSNMLRFNTENQDSNKVFYQSMASTMNIPQDDLFYALSFKYLRRTAGENDGMVTLENTRWGEKFEHVKTTKGISHAGITDIGRMKIGNLNIPQVYPDVVDGLKSIGL
ncbi:esterase/lipase family protein [Sphingobacterium tabacisoli]|uniref:Esterase/lipase family protein n=1 Tax=Sphingobacterium tabacisoli TaxID=2044855 RepID=A0ABW5L8U3_9SPHI